MAACSGGNITTLLAACSGMGGAGTTLTMTKNWILARSQTS